MCGICGWVDPTGGVRAEALGRMVARLGHRGPDGRGLWQDPDGVAALGHTRLRVLDTSPRADQPMIGRRGTVLVYNGEMYAFRALRRELEGEGWSFSTSGDTEVVLAALERWGAAALDRFSGMFALALWNPAERRLLLVRDRIGIKPLFWARVGRGIAFASEIPALLAHPGVGRDLSREGLAAWLQLGTTAGAATLVRGVRRLPPGHLLELVDGEIAVRPWYDPLEASRTAPAVRAPGDAAEALGARIVESVRERLVSDVPLGCFLSGGVDSAVVTAAAVASGARPESLTVGFPGGRDETPRAAAAAGRLGITHRVVPCPAAAMEAVLGRWEEVGSDPIADPSLAPTWVVSEAARERWTVALSGDGGDELLSGYPRLRFMPRLHRLWRTPGARGLLARAPLPAARWAAKLRAAAAAPDTWRAYQCLQGVWPGAAAARLLGEAEAPLPWPEGVVRRLAAEPPWRRYRLLDLLTFLPERVLAKVDRASMSHGLEVRVPLLDHRVVELAAGLPEHLARGKGLLRTVLARLAPGLRPSGRKRGFEVPLGAWLRGPLGEPIRRASLWAAREIGLDEGFLEAAWEEHERGAADHAERLFAVGVLGRWCRRWLA